ncbi:glycoside hydrolase superfamily [Protomyces lactucae-debilis]|uniref:glucan 1,3-beta-glucosidase n=1 Tax=Protomyces lactucae-debilis TaxID=2754530 RepID=A0A1Y2FS26_PROLT|nr:glycoside hydrolase superfamily [Protomyces lactucae-debilis]ORY86387.1 glycoside hydrolase superfamily [Protomyces lactucae-debilis]
MHLISASLLLQLVATVLAAPAKRAASFAYGVDKVRGVNLGGWLVLEPWIKPSLFNQFLTGTPAVDEYTFCQVLGPDAAAAQLRQHWDTWFTEGDFARLAASGLNHVRLPVGYWAFNKIAGEPFIDGQAIYVDKAIGWAQKYNLKLWIDLHGAWQSQNGFDNSGRFGRIGWGTAETVQHTIDTLQVIVNRYGRNPGVAGIELLNEPAGFAIDPSIIRDFHQRGYQVAKSTDRFVIIHDAFLRPDQTYNNFPASQYPNAAMDAHLYQVFSPGENAMSHQTHLTVACKKRSSLAGAKGKMPIIVGEWSGAETDCAQWLNGFNRGARYDGSFPDSYYIGSCANKNSLDAMNGDERNQVKEFILAQLDAFEAGGDGWIFWTAKTESADLWNFQKLFDYGLFPVGARGFCDPFPWS